MLQTRYRVFLLSLALIVLSCTIALLAFSSQYKERESLRAYVSASAVEERLGSIFSAINDFPGSAGKDMLFLRTLSSLSNIQDRLSDGSWRATQQDLQQFMDRNAAYAEMYVYIGRVGCTVSVKRVSDEGGNVSCGSVDEIAEARASLGDLPIGSVYISPLYEHIHLTKGKEERVPALQYATRISSPGNEDGVIVAVVNANYFLDEVRRLGRDDEMVYLVNQDGSYIAHPDASKEMFSGGSANFYRDYPETPPDILSDPSANHFETRDSIFTFMRVTPTASNFALYENTHDVSDRYWIMAAVSEKGTQAPWWLNTSYLIAFCIVLVVHVLVAVMLYIALFPVMRRSSL